MSRKKIYRVAVADGVKRIFEKRMEECNIEYKWILTNRVRNLWFTVYEVDATHNFNLVCDKVDEIIQELHKYTCVTDLVK